MQPDSAAILANAPPQSVRLPPQRPGDLVPWLPWSTVAIALVIAGFDLSRRSLPKGLVKGVNKGTAPILSAMQAIHSGLIGDYVTWLVVGVALFSIVCAIG
jgi:multicomponent Na+:H+ antiporter subunit D